MDPQISLRLHQTSSDFRNYTTWKGANGSDGFTPWRMCRKGEIWEEGEEKAEKEEERKLREGLFFSSRVRGSLPLEWNAVMRFRKKKNWIFYVTDLSLIFSTCETFLSPALVHCLPLILLIYFSCINLVHFKVAITIELIPEQLGKTETNVHLFFLSRCNYFLSLMLKTSSWSNTKCPFYYWIPAEIVTPKSKDKGAISSLTVHMGKIRVWCVGFVLTNHSNQLTTHRYDQHIRWHSYATTNPRQKRRGLCTPGFSQRVSETDGRGSLLTSDHSYTPLSLMDIYLFFFPQQITYTGHCTHASHPSLWY